VRRLALALALVLVVAGCGGKKDTTAPAGSDRVQVMLDFFPNADHVGLYAALAQGEFRRAGLDVQVRKPSDPAAPLKLLAGGKIDLAISYEPELLLARDRGAQLVSVAAIVQRPLTSVISLASKKLRGPTDLAGRTVGTAGIPYQAAYLKTILARAHVPAAKVRQVNVGFNLVPAMLSGRVDATLGGFWNYEGIQLRQRKKKPRVTPVDRLGVPSYSELVLVARRDTLVRHGALVRRFVQALGRGYASARRDPAAAVDALLEQNPELAKDRRLQEASVRATLPAFFPSRASRPFGFQDPAAWQRYALWMYDHKLLTRPPVAPAAITNEFLAGQGA
jgi:putative hydroxymethylpyrimidine transport system substrate-binding protein